MQTFYKKILFFLLLKILFFYPHVSLATEESFSTWLSNFKNFAINEGVSSDTVEDVFKDVKFLDKVIGYDRKQPEFFEDTITYVKKRATFGRIKKGKELFKKNKELFTEVEGNFDVEKEILLALWAIETNYGKNVGKMDIISCLATLSYDKRRRDFFSSQLLILLQLVDKKIINPKTLFGSWAGAYGNFQFMPSTIRNYAIDYDKNNKIELKSSLKDSLASAANYINKIGWQKGQPCFYRVNITRDIKKKYINLSARSISYRFKISKWKKFGLTSFDGSELEDNFKAALILPDGKPNSPAYLVFSNYEKILKWNRSLRFGITVCTLANKIKA